MPRRRDDYDGLFRLPSGTAVEGNQGLVVQGRYATQGLIKKS
jgi:hypothetical protein